MSAPIEMTTRYATTVNDLADAWAFVMEHLDNVGPDPSIHISPTWTMRSGEDEFGGRQFTVVVDGMVEVGKAVE